MLWLQNKRKWYELTDRDFLTIMPNPRFNKIDRPLILSQENLIYMVDKSYEFLSMYRDDREHGLKPWMVREGGKVLSEDINALDMLKRLEADIEEYNNRMREAEQKTKAYIQDNY